MKDWIEEVNQELDGLNKRTSFIQESNQDIFINFNYTTTLENVYDIPRRNVLHIHGVVDSEVDLVLGHSNSDRKTYFLEKYREFQNKFDEQKAPIYNALAEYCSKTYKDVNIYKHQLIPLLFDSIQKVMIIGHSLSTVDLPYFKEIKESIGEEVDCPVCSLQVISSFSKILIFVLLFLSNLFECIYIIFFIFLFQNF